MFYILTSISTPWHRPWDLMSWNETDPTGYLWSKYKCPLIKGQDINLEKKFIPQESRFFYPLSHQGGVLQKCRTPRWTPWELQGRSGNAVGTPSNAVGNPRTPRVGVSFGHAITRRSNKSAVGTPWGRCGNAVRTSSTRRELRGRAVRSNANVVQTPW